MKCSQSLLEKFAYMYVVVCAIVGLLVFASTYVCTYAGTNLANAYDQLQKIYHFHSISWH